MKSLHILGWVTLAAAGLHAQSTTGPVYWVATQPDCSGLSVFGEQHTVTITNSAGATLGYSCYVSGTFVWLAAGGQWGTTIRVGSPASGAVGADFSFYDPSGNNLSLDTVLTGASSPTSGNNVQFALFANQPTELKLLGAPSSAPNYTLQTGSVYVTFYCPNATTCLNIRPQLLYSALPSIPWSLSVPMAVDGFASSQWSAAGIDDGGSRRVSMVVYNQGSVASIYTVRVYDSTGALAGTGTTPAIAGFGTYGDLLSNIVKTKLPSGIFKILIDGGSNFSSVAVLQVTGQSATTLEIGYDTAPTASAVASPASRSSVRRQDVSSTPHQVFGGLAK